MEFGVGNRYFATDSESALRVVLDVTESDELKRLREENRKLREMHAALEGLAKGHSDKYCDLVWLARSDRYGSEPHIREIIEKKIAEYPEDYAEMKDPDTGDWTHGFNSGMLAASRLYHEYTALEEFVWNDVDECYCLCEPDPDHRYGRCDCCDFGSDEEPDGAAGVRLRVRGAVHAARRGQRAADRGARRRADLRKLKFETCRTKKKYYN